MLKARLKAQNRLKALDDDYAKTKKGILDETHRTIKNLSSDDAVNKALENAQKVQDALKKASGYDVTGQLGTKVKSLFAGSGSGTGLKDTIHTCYNSDTHCITANS